MIRQTHLVASRLASRRGLSHWALSALLLAVSGCSVECHSSTSHSTSSSSGNERTAVQEHENEGNEPGRAQSGRGDVVRVVSTEEHDSSNPPADANGHEHGRGHGNRQVVHPSGSTPSNHTEAEGGGSAGASGADSAATGAASSGADSSGSAASSGGAASSSGETPADSGATAGAASEQPEAGKKPRTPSNKRENEPHVARPVKKRPVAKGENREADEGSSVNKTGSRE